MGDLGGLFDFLNYFFYWMLVPFTSFDSSVGLISSLYGYRVRTEQNSERQRDQPLSTTPSNDLDGDPKNDPSAKFQSRIDSRKPIKRKVFTTYLLCKVDRSYKKKIRRSEAALTREMDLRKFLEK